MDCLNEPINYPKTIIELRKRIRRLNESLVDELCFGEEVADCARGLKFDYTKKVVENGRQKSRLIDANTYMSEVGRLWHDQLTSCTSELDCLKGKIKEMNQEEHQLNGHLNSLSMELASCYDEIDSLKKQVAISQLGEQRQKRAYAEVWDELRLLQKKVTEEAAEKSKLLACLEEHKETAIFYKIKYEESRNLGENACSSGPSWLEELEEVEGVAYKCANDPSEEAGPEVECDQHEAKLIKHGEAVPVLSAKSECKSVQQSGTNKPFKFEINGCQSYHRTSQLIVLKRSDSKKNEKKPYSRPAVVVKKCFN